MGTMEEAVFQRHQNTKEKLPDRIANAPEVEFGLMLYWNGFLALSSCRSAAYGTEGPIPWTAMRDYCNEHELDEEQRSLFHDCVAAMDKVYLDHKGKKAQKAAQGG